MRMRFKSCLALAVGAGTLAFAVSASAQEKMTMDEYMAALKQAQDREAQAQADLQACNDDKSRITGEISSTEQMTASTWNDIYSAMGTDRAGVDAYRNQLNGLEREVDGLRALSPEELYRRRAELDDIQSRLDAMKQSKIYALTEMQNKVASIEGKISDLRNRMPKSMYDNYTVMRGDYLWRISGKSDIYGDPMQWMRIYSVNRDQIKDPDLIYPDQNLKIHRGVGPNEYLVAKGDFLSKIAGMNGSMGSATSWTKLYEANRDVIGDDPSMIYPYQVLKMPR